MKSGKRKIRMTLDTRSIDAAIAEVKGRKRYTETRIAKICNVLCDRAVEICKANLLAEGAYKEGDLYRSIKADAICENGRFRIFLKADSRHAAYVEFGSGIVGRQNKHPQVGEKRAERYKKGGWYTQADGKDMEAEYGWEPIFGKDGSVYYFTLGQPAKPFMYNTMVQLRKEFPEIVKEVFGH